MLSFFTFAATTTTTAGAVPNASSEWTRALIQLAAIIVIFYLFFIRPQQKKAKEQMQMLNSLKVGDEIIVSGMIGKIAKIINEAEILVEVADGVKIKVLRSFVSNVLIEKESAKPFKKEVKE